LSAFYLLGNQQAGMGVWMAYILTALFAIFAFRASVQAADKIRVAMPADAGHFTVPLAQKRGFLKEEGIDAEIVTISGPVANIALASGEIDYFTGFGSAMRAVIQGQLPARIVAIGPYRISS
jgi:ABC-type nitrate/sulfonate/bicarbonate transport system substrate-binding protein